MRNGQEQFAAKKIALEISIWMSLSKARIPRSAHDTEGVRRLLEEKNISREQEEEKRRKREASKLYYRKGTANCTPTRPADCATHRPAAPPSWPARAACPAAPSPAGGSAGRGPSRRPRGHAQRGKSATRRPPQRLPPRRRGAATYVFLIFSP